MNSAVAADVLTADASQARRTHSVTAFGALAVAGFASLGAGAVHAAAVGAHSEHHQVVVLFTAVAVFQMAWGAWALVSSNRWVALIGLLGNLGLFAGWGLAKTEGISFIKGLEIPEPVQTADGLAAGLALVAVLGAVGVLVHARWWRLPSQSMVSVFGVLVAAITLPGMIAAGNHVHAHGIVGPTGKVEPVAAVAPTPYDPTQPIELGGVPGVTPQEQARAENLVATTLLNLPQFADQKTALAAGYHSIGDGITGFEHLVNWSYIDDDKILDPDYPESLVYSTAGGGKKLVSAMFMMPQGSTLDSVPDIGGKLTQWHIHDNLCFTADALSPQVVGITDANGNCAAPLKKFTPVPMIHVWIVPNECGPFAALEGVGAGQVKPGEVRSCDHVHGKVG